MKKDLGRQCCDLLAVRDSGLAHGQPRAGGYFAGNCSLGPPPSHISPVHDTNSISPHRCRGQEGSRLSVRNRAAHPPGRLLPL